MGGRKKKKIKKEEPDITPLQVEEPMVEQQMIDPISISIFIIVIKGIIAATASFFTGVFWKWWVKDDKESKK